MHPLSLLLAAVVKDEVPWTDALDWWQRYRQARVDRTVELTERMNVRRLPGWMGGEGDVVDSTWLFSVQIDKDVAEWVGKYGKEKIGNQHQCEEEDRRKVTVQE